MPQSVPESAQDKSKKRKRQQKLGLKALQRKSTRLNMKKAKGIKKKCKKERSGKKSK